MINLRNFLLYSTFLGVLSTFFLDVWNFARHWLFDAPLTKYEFIGRWLLYMPEGKFVHESIRKADPLAGELLIGWMGHYAIGILFAMMLLGIWGLNWPRKPTLLPALFVGMVTVAIPYFIMQPGMGSGIAGSLTPDPTAARMKVIISHLVFSAGLYLSGWLLSLLVRQKSIRATKAKPG